MKYVIKNLKCQFTSKHVIPKLVKLDDLKGLLQLKWVYKKQPIVCLFFMMEQESGEEKKLKFYWMLVLTDYLMSYRWQPC